MASLNSVSSEPAPPSSNWVLLLLPEAPEELLQGGLGHKTFATARTVPVCGSSSNARTWGSVFDRRNAALQLGLRQNSTASSTLFTGKEEHHPSSAQRLWKTRHAGLGLHLPAQVGQATKRSSRSGSPLI